MANIVIRDVVTIDQGGHTIYQFKISAPDLLRYGVVKRFGADKEGVNRPYREEHALDIAEYMTERSGAVMMDAVCVNLAGPWKFDESEGILTGRDGAQIVVDDGQHRYEAIKVLSDEERARWEFPVTALMNATLEERLLVFQQQAERWKIDPRLHLAQRDATGNWRTASDGEAYQIAKRLNTEDDSPLKGRIWLAPKDPTTKERSLRLVNVVSLMRVLKPFIGPHHSFHRMSPEDRYLTIKRLFQAAAATWRKQWNDVDKQVVARRQGVFALVYLLLNGGNFNREVGATLTYDNFCTALNLARGFKWDAKELADDDPLEIARRLDQKIGASRGRSA